MKRIAFLMIALFMIGGVVMAQGQRGEHKKMTPAERAEKMTERMVKEYSLNDAQKKQLLEAKDGVFEGKIKMKVHDVEDIQKMCVTLSKIQNIKSVGRVAD